MTGSIPTGFLRKLRTLTFQYIHPVGLWLDRQYRFRACMGEVGYYGYSGLRPGQDCTHILPFLVGLEATDSLTLPFLETPNQRAAHVEVLPEQDGIAIVFLDASEQRANQADAQQKANELTLLHREQCKLIQAMKQLEAELVVKRDKAEAADRLKSRFIGNMSHEFRTPLTSILGFTTRLQQTLKSNNNTKAQQQQYLNSIEKSAQHLLTLVENLLDQSQIEADSLVLHPEPVAIKALLHELQVVFTPLAEDKALAFTLSYNGAIPEYIELDTLRFRQILVNLLGNAIKFTERGSVDLQVNWADGVLTICVTDTGTGIATDDQKRIFDAFEQLQHKPGTGLGLSIVQHLVEKMQGCLSLDSAPGEGSCFRIRLPGGKTSPPDRREEPCPEHMLPDFEQAAGKTLLIVEDDTDIQVLLCGIFEEVGYRVQTAADGLTAITTALAVKPDLVLMDMNLPGLNGFDATRQLREKGFSQPVFALSAWASGKGKTRAMAAGCDQYLQKPPNINQLLKLVTQTLRAGLDVGMPAERHRQLRTRFNASIPNKLEQLNTLCLDLQQTPTSSQSWEALQQFFHRIAGSAQLYGYADLSAAAQRLDNLLAEHKTDAFCALPAELGTVFSALEVVQQQLQTIATASGPAR